MGASPQGGKLAGRKASMSALAKRAVIDSFAKLTPREQAKNPVMALSSTDAAPMTISPSAGICSFAAT